MINRIKPIWYLLLGIAIFSITHMSFNIDFLGWISSVPFLIYLSLTKTWKSRLLFVLALIIAWSFVVSKIITPPVSSLFIFLFSIPISLFHLPGYLLWDRFKKHKESYLLFPAIMTLMEWIQYSFTPFGSWGIAAYTQSQTISIMQSVSLFGIAGLSFLIYWVNISITEIIVKQKTTPSTLLLPFAFLFLLISYGALRFDISKSIGTETILLAAVGTDSKVTGLPLPSKKENEEVKKALFERTKLAAQNGAKLVVWNEAATFTMLEEETDWIDALKALSAELKTPLIAAYVVPTSESPFTYENKYLFIDSTGSISYTYHKHQPVPGEPAFKGEEELKVFEVAGSIIGGVICYDYDFPYLAKGFGHLGADIVAIPSSTLR